MKNIKPFKQKARAIILFAVTLLSAISLNAQFGTIKDADNYPGRNAPKDEMHAFLKKKIQQSIELADYTALVYVPTISANDAEAYNCFYGEDGKTIYTAVKVLLKHDYKGNFVTQNKEAIVVVRGGIIGDDDQFSPWGDSHLHYPRLSTGETYLLTVYSPPEEFQNRRHKDIPVYFIKYDQIPYANGQGLLIQHHGFTTEDEFDSFVYRALKKARKKRKKKDVGFGDLPLGSWAQ